MPNNFYQKINSLSFIVKNVSPQKKTISIFNCNIPYGKIFDLMSLKGVTENYIKDSLNSGELLNKIKTKNILIISSSIDLLEFDAGQRSLISSAYVGYPDDLNGTNPITQCGAASVLNRRSIQISAVSSGGGTFTKTLSPAMPDTNYDVFVETDYLVGYYVVNKTINSFDLVVGTGVGGNINIQVIWRG